MGDIMVRDRSRIKKFIFLIVVLFLVPTTLYAKQVKLTMSDVAVILKRQNLSLKALNARLKAFNSDLYNAVSVFLPSVTLSGYYQQNHNNPLLPFHENRGYFLEVKQLLFSPSSLFAIEKAKLAKEAFAVKYEQLFQQLLWETKDVFLSIIEINAMKDVISGNKILAERYLSVLKKRYQNGEVSKYEVLRAKEEVNLLDYQYQKVIALRMKLISELKVLLGMDESIKLVVDQKIAFKDVHLDLTQLEREAKLYSPSLKVEKLRLKIALVSKNSAVSEFLPSVFLDYKDEADKLTAFNPGRAKYDHYNQLMVVVNLPIFEGGRRFSAIFKAKQIVRQKRLEYKKARLELFSKLQALYKQFLAYKAQVKATQLTLLRAQDLYNIMKKRYDSGQASYLNVIDSRNTLMRAQMDNISALKDYYSALFQIESLVGKEVSYEDK